MRSHESGWESIMQAEDSGERVEARIQGAQMSTGERHAMAAYIDMLARCYLPARTEYANDGARGIAVCDRWLVGFHNFVQDVGLPPKADGGDSD